MGKEKNSIIHPMCNNNKTYIDMKEKANAFKETFIAFSKLDSSQAEIPDIIYIKQMLDLMTFLSHKKKSLIFSKALMPQKPQDQMGSVHEC